MLGHWGFIYFCWLSHHHCIAFVSHCTLLFSPLMPLMFTLLRHCHCLRCHLPLPLMRLSPLCLLYWCWLIIVDAAPIISLSRLIRMPPFIIIILSSDICRLLIITLLPISLSHCLQYVTSLADTVEFGHVIYYLVINAAILINNNIDCISHYHHHLGRCSSLISMSISFASHWYVTSITPHYFDTINHQCHQHWTIIISIILITDYSMVTEFRVIIMGWLLPWSSISSISMNFDTL